MGNGIGTPQALQETRAYPPCPGTSRSREFRGILHGDRFPFFPDHVPARTVAEVREQGVNAGLCFWISEIIFVLTVLVWDRVEAPDFHDFKRITGSVSSHSVPHREVVATVHEGRQENGDDQYSLQVPAQMFCLSIAPVGLRASGSPERSYRGLIAWIPIDVGAGLFRLRLERETRL
jgi:hypothetical protein